jgi:phenylacetate-coenzyme A ligase PaaK-like adenylate-forming protein
MRREKIREYQLERLSRSVDYAFANLTIYRKYGAVSCESFDIKTFEDFANLPILYKDELTKGFSNDILKDVDDFKYLTRSSGSIAGGL